jgi:isoleucyl-tRNA synthetase
MSVELKDTLNLPSTPFPMRASLTTREPDRIRHWETTRLYERIQQRPAPNGTYVLHDGPPFTNGDVHIGTALNKLLKDIILRYKSMRGYRTPYIPGWDCHGLPIEHKVMKELQAQKTDPDPLAIRHACAKFSAAYIEKQRAQFRRLGILADWTHEYKTMAPAYEAEILRTLATIVEQGLVYRSKKPVYWSIPCATALAEAEIEYKDKRSPSIWVPFPLPQKGPRHAIVIWTTTPWTLPANLAIAVHPGLAYVEIHHNDNTYLVASALADTFIATCKLNGATHGATHPGHTLEGLQARHPFINRASPIVLANYVTTDTGTGCVHTAPGHGLDDYNTGLKYGLDIYCPVTDAGVYANDGKIPPHLAGISVLETNGQCPANDAVIKTLQARDALLKLEHIQHQYPHCWRSKTPVIFRAMYQWFIAIDHDSKRQRALDTLDTVTWTPAWGENRIRAAIENRPDWCISRQRSWGVPIPAFYAPDGKPHLDPAIIRAIADKVATSGTNIWYEQTPAQLLDPRPPLPPGFPPVEQLAKGTDTLDVWIDSGTSHNAVLTPAHHPHLHWPADLYLEGSDQHRGWFQSSLWTAILTRNAPPYKRVITHGFVVNEKRQKISKSDGKPQTADSYIDKYGADIIRLWIASENYQNDIPLSDAILDAVATQYRTLRNTLRYQLSNLNDYPPAQPLPTLTLTDKWALQKLAELVRDVTTAYESFEFHKAYAALTLFITNTLSATYHSILKDRLYTLAPNHPDRRGAQGAMQQIFTTYIRLLAPILPFTTDEAWSHHQKGQEHTHDSIHLQPWPQPPDLDTHATDATEFEQLLLIRDQINTTLETLRQNKTIGQSLDAQVHITADPSTPHYALLQKHARILAETFIVSQVTLTPAPAGAPLHIQTTKATGERCPRCWRYEPTLQPNPATNAKLCPRCNDALSAL